MEFEFYAVEISEALIATNRS